MLRFLKNNPSFLLGNKLSTFLIEHGYGAEDEITTPTEQDISKTTSYVQYIGKSVCTP